MSQISPPIRILLVCAVAFMAAWMLFLRPSTDAGTPAVEAPVPTATTPPVAAGGEKADSLAGKAVEAANDATAQQDARAEQLAAGTGETAAPAQASTATTPTAEVTKTGAPTAVAMPTKEALALVPKGVREAIVKRQIIVLGVVAKAGADEQRVRESLRNVNRLHGRVYVQTVPVEKLSRYGTIAGGANVSQTPSVVIIDFGLKATTLAGYVPALTIDQAVVDAIRNSGRLYPDPYVKQVAKACTHLMPDVRIIFEPTSRSDVERMIGRTSVQLGQFERELAALTTPKKWRSFSKATRADVASMASTLAAAQASLGSNPTLAHFVAADKRYTPALNRAGKRLDKRFAEHDVISCLQG
jgi:hypothetical protein